MPKYYHHLTQEQRCQIAALKTIGMSNRAIARTLKVASTTIDREISRNAGSATSSEFYYTIAHKRAVSRRKAASARPRKLSPALISRLNAGIRQEYSPDQLAGRFLLNGVTISHETIYKHIRKDRRNGGRLFEHLRQGGKKRYQRAGKDAGVNLIPNRKSIHDRPAIVETKSRIGDGEGDLIVGAKHQGFIFTYVDRASKYLLMAKSLNKSAVAVTAALLARFSEVKGFYTPITITFDNGKEFSLHETITKATGAQVYFADPYRSNQRGLNEHTNGLVRQYLPKKTSLLDVTDERLRFIENRLNNRPRKVLGYKTPYEVLSFAHTAALHY